MDYKQIDHKQVLDFQMLFVFGHSLILSIRLNRGACETHWISENLIVFDVDHDWNWMTCDKSFADKYYF